MMIMQTPLPPPGVSPVPVWVAPFVAAMLLMALGAWLLRPLVRAWAKRLEGHPTEPAILDEMAQLRDRVGELEVSVAQLHELEERLDFAERLLAAQREPSRERLAP